MSHLGVQLAADVQLKRLQAAETAHLSVQSADDLYLKQLDAAEMPHPGAMLAAEAAAHATAAEQIYARP